MATYIFREVFIQRKKHGSTFKFLKLKANLRNTYGSRLTLKNLVSGGLHFSRSVFFLGIPINRKVFSPCSPRNNVPCICSSCHDPTKKVFQPFSLPLFSAKHPPVSEQKTQAMFLEGKRGLLHSNTSQYQARPVPRFPRLRPISTSPASWKRKPWFSWYRHALLSGGIFPPTKTWCCDAIEFFPYYNMRMDGFVWKKRNPCHSHRCHTLLFKLAWYCKKTILG